PSRRRQLRKQDRNRAIWNLACVNWPNNILVMFCRDCGKTLRTFQSRTLTLISLQTSSKYEPLWKETVKVKSGTSRPMVRLRCSSIWVPSDTPGRQASKVSSFEV